MFSTTVAGMLMLQATNPFAPSIHTISTPEGFSLFSLVQVSQDGRTLLFSARPSDSTGGNHNLFVWTLENGLQSVPNSPFFGPVTAPVRSFEPVASHVRARLSRDGNTVFGFSSGVPTVWRRSTNSHDTIGLAFGAISDFNEDGSKIIGVLGPTSLITASREFVEWTPFNADTSIFTRLMGDVWSIFNDQTMNENLVQVRIGNGNDFGGILQIFRWIRGGLNPLTRITGSHASREVLGYARDASAYMVDEGVRQGASSNRVRIYNRSDTLVAELPNDSTTSLPANGSFSNTSRLTEFGKFAVAANNFWRADLGVVVPSMFLQRYFPAQVVRDNFSNHHFVAISGRANTIISRFPSGRGDFKVVYHPETFRNITGSRFRVTTKLVVRPRRISALVLDDDSTPDHLEVEYNIQGPFVGANNTINGSPVSMTYNQSLTLGSNVAYTWNNSSSQNISITGGISDRDGTLGLDSLLRGPFTITPTDLRNGGKTFGLSGDVALVIESTYLGPVIDPNS